MRVESPSLVSSTEPSVTRAFKNTELRALLINYYGPRRYARRAATALGISRHTLASYLLGRVRTPPAIYARLAQLGPQLRQDQIRWHARKIERLNLWLDRQAELLETTVLHAKSLHIRALRSQKRGVAPED